MRQQGVYKLNAERFKLLEEAGKLKAEQSKTASRAHLASGRRVGALAAVLGALVTVAVLRLVGICTRG